MTNLFLDYENSKVNCLTFGKGDRLMIAFPGYGDVAANYKVLHFLEKTHRVYIVDLPNHGRTTWNKGYFNIADFENIVQLILAKEKVNRFELMGHSFSGRVVFLLMEKFVTQLDRIYLLAPDGLENETFRLAFHFPIFLRKWIWQSVKNPNPWIKLTKWLSQLRLLPKHSYTFMQYNLTHPNRRDRLFLYWLSMNNFKTNPKRIKQFLQHHNVPLQFILGQYDKIVPPKAAIQLGNNLTSASVEILEKEHDLVKELGKHPLFFK